MFRERHQFVIPAKSHMGFGVFQNIAIAIRLLSIKARLGPAMLRHRWDRLLLSGICSLLFTLSFLNFECEVGFVEIPRISVRRLG